MVLAGRGAVAAGARAEMLALAERIGAVLVTSLQAKGWVRGEAFDLGLAGGFSHDLCREVLAEADLVLAVGAHLNRFTVAHGSLFPHARLVQVDQANVEPAVVGCQWYARRNGQRENLALRRLGDLLDHAP